MSVLRSMLFIPGDSEKKLGNGDQAGADALIIDLEDSVLPDNKPRARGLTVEYLKARPKNGRRSEAVGNRNCRGAVQLGRLLISATSAARGADLGLRGFGNRARRQHQSRCVGRMGIYLPSGAVAHADGRAGCGS